MSLKEDLIRPHLTAPASVALAYCFDPELHGVLMYSPEGRELIFNCGHIETNVRGDEYFVSECYQTELVCNNELIKLIRLDEKHIKVSVKNKTLTMAIYEK